MSLYVVNLKGSLITAIAGLFVLASVALGYFVTPWFFLFTAFVGLMLFLASVTGLCPMYWILKQLNVGKVCENLGRCS
jgi:hypothetical protein